MIVPSKNNNFETQYTNHYNAILKDNETLYENHDKQNPNNNDKIIVNRLTDLYSIILNLDYKYIVKKHHEVIIMSIYII